MKRSFCLFIVVTGVLLSGCVSKGELNAGKEIQEMLGASKSTVAYGKSASTESGSHKYINLTLEGVPAAEKSLASVCAYHFYKKSPPVNGSYDMIEVNLKDKDASVSGEYGVSDLATVDTILDEQVAKFIKLIGREEIKALLDPRLDDSLQNRMLTVFHQRDSMCGAETNKPLFKGYYLSKMEGTDEPIVTFWMVVYYEQCTQNYLLSLSRKTGKFINIKGE